MKRDDDLLAVDEHRGESAKYSFSNRRRKLNEFLPFIFGVDGLCVALSKPEE